MANPTTNYGFVLPTATDLVTDLPADFDVALQGVDTRLKALQPGTTLGDLAYSSATANTNTRLGIGTTGQVLTVTGGVPAWSTISAGAITLLSTTTLSGASTTISSINQGYTNIYGVMYGLTNGVANYGQLNVIPNNTAGTMNWYANSGGAPASGGTVVPTHTTRTGTVVNLAFNANPTRTDANNFWIFEIDNYSSTTTYKQFSSTGSYGQSTDRVVVNTLGVWASNTAITSLVISQDSGGSFSTGTVLLYGVK
jgi:hypothetical protein